MTPDAKIVADALICFLNNQGEKIRNHDELIDYIIEAKRIHQPPTNSRKTIDYERQDIQR